MRKRFEDKIAIVTGGANGFGRGMVETLVKEGAKVVAVDIEEDTLKEVFKGMEEDVMISFTDVTDKNQVDKMVEATIERFGRIDILFNNAGDVRRGKFLEVDLEDWMDIIDVNLNSVFIVGQAVAKKMVTQESKGVIVNTSSVTATKAGHRTGAYAPSKAGVSALTKLMALELAEHGIRVNAFGPGTSMTRITEGTRFDPERNEMFLKSIPLGRYGEIREAVAVALFLASDDASYITGTTVYEDGGMLL